MDPKLYNAACNGDVATLLELKKENPLILHNVTLEPSDTVLHISTKLGFADFAKVVMDQNRALATEINDQGFYPIHLASANGYSQIVTDLLNIDSELCFLKDRDGRTPLHCAAIKGRQAVMELLLSRCPEEAKKLTNKKETILHLAVKNYQCEAIKYLLSRLIQNNLADDLVNCMDQDGNTVLHLATASKQVQTIEILLRDTMVNVNLVNGKGKTALDIAKLCTSESDVMIIEKMLHEAQQPRELESSEEHRIDVKNYQHNSPSLSQSPSPIRRQRRSPRPRRSGSPSRSPQPTIFEKRFESVKNGIIILASMCAAFSFGAALSPPGGLWQDWPSNNNITNIIQTTKIDNFINSPLMDPFQFFPKKLQFVKAPHLNFSSSDLHNPGKAMNIVLASYDFVHFLYSDALCFTTSLVTIVLIIITPNLGHEDLRAMLIYFMTLIIIGSSMYLYYSVLALIANRQVAGWAFKVFAIQFFSFLLLDVLGILFYLLFRWCIRLLVEVVNWCIFRIIMCF